MFTPRRKFGAVVEFVEFEDGGGGTVPFEGANGDVLCGGRGIPVPLEDEIEGTVPEGVATALEDPITVLSEAAIATGAVVPSEKLRLSEGFSLGSAKCICVSVVVVA